MALLSVQQATSRGTVVTYAAAAAGGDTFSRVSDRTELRVKNGGAGAITVTVAVPGNTSYGVANPALASNSIAAGAEVVLAPIPAQAVDPADGLVHVTYSGVTSVTVAVVSL